MIAKHQYEEAKRIVAEYEQQLSALNRESSFRIGDVVRTTKRYFGSEDVRGEIVGFTTRSGVIKCVKIRKFSDSKIVVCREENLMRIP